ncbi:G2/mitotic-specific cyclin S13-7 isoform X2 [Nematostella vectensis]|uniref:G2/mitotic-specific cyclin S13-7 isoform X2 n=1 Tax=Nematostella vectensis TaxID=45351 RepID=UPI00207792C9|nr:G2/mitotic-specific cyclin S13-7 isoform X2 [Nematostella vectensis]
MLQSPEKSSSKEEKISADDEDCKPDLGCPSTGTHFVPGILCAPRPRTRSRLNDSGFFDEDNKVTDAENTSFTVASDQGRDTVEDWASVSSYRSQIMRYAMALENKYQLPENFLEKQGEVSHQARAVLIDWLIEVHLFYNFPQDCLYLIVALVDRYMSLRTVPVAHFQLLGMACLLVACKYEDRFVPTREELVAMADQAFDQSELRHMETRLLTCLEFDLAQPLPTFFLRPIARASAIDLETYVVSKFIMEAAMLDAIMVTFKPSIIAATAFFMARGFVWEDGRLIQTVPGSGYKYEDLRPCLLRMSEVLLDLENMECKGILRKYNRLGLCPSIIRSFVTHPIMKQLTSTTS